MRSSEQTVRAVVEGMQKTSTKLSRGDWEWGNAEGMASKESFDYVKVRKSNPSLMEGLLNRAAGRNPEGH